MYKSLILNAFMVLLAASCGNKSTIKTHIESRSLGDGEHVTFPLVVPLSENAISSFDGPISTVNPLIRIVSSNIMGIGASIGAGKQGLTLIQPIPRIPENYIGSIKIKRILFLMEPTNVSEEKESSAVGRAIKWLDSSKDNFKFLRRLAVKISSTNHTRVADSWEPVIVPGAIDKKELNGFSRHFRTSRNKRAKNWDNNSTGFILIDYNQDDEDGNSLRDPKEVGGVINIIKTDNPYATRKYLEDNYGEYLYRIHTLSRSIIVELKNDRVVQEMFRMRLAADAAQVAELGIGEIAPCERSRCLDFKMKDKNLMPILNSGNAIKIDTYIDPKNVPKDFQLKGFIEFEVKIKSVL